MQSTHLFPLMVALLPTCSSQIRTALMQMLMYRFLENILSIVLSLALFPGISDLSQTRFLDWKDGNNASTPAP